MELFLLFWGRFYFGPFHQRTLQCHEWFLSPSNGPGTPFLFGHDPIFVGSCPIFLGHAPIFPGSRRLPRVPREDQEDLAQKLRLAIAAPQPFALS